MSIIVFHCIMKALFAVACYVIHLRGGGGAADWYCGNDMHALIRK